MRSEKRSGKEEVRIEHRRMKGGGGGAGAGVCVGGGGGGRGKKTLTLKLYEDCSLGSFKT